ncbi:hypothetical protein MASR2M47_30470 [Draconibacterium sp.]
MNYQVIIIPKIFTYHVAPNFRNISLKLNLEMKGDTLIQVYPCDDSFYYDINNCVIQKYVRVD